MIAILLTTIPFFALVLLGYVATRLRLMGLSAIPGLNTFVLYFALPCMLFRFGAQAPINKLLDLGVFVVYLSVALLLVAFTVCLTLHGRIYWRDASLGALVVAFPNTGFMGVPLLTALLGAQAMGPAIATIAIDIVITSSLCVALSRIEGDASKRQRSTWHSTKSAFKGVMVNPMPWAILIGGAFSWYGFELLGPFARVVALLGDSASPTALFTIGTVLARPAVIRRARQMGFQRTRLPTTQNAESRGFGSSTQSPFVNTASGSEGNAGQTYDGHFTPPTSKQSKRSLKSGRYWERDVWLLAGFKLFLHPLLVLFMGIFARSLGLPLDTLSLTAIVLVAALPSASNVSLLAERFGANTERIAQIILLSTFFAFFSFAGAVALLKD